MIVEQTSLDAYTDLRESFALGESQLRVLNCLRESPISLSHFQIAARLGVFPNNVTGRIKELEKDGFVVHDGFTLNVTGKRAKAWKAVK